MYLKNVCAFKYNETSFDAKLDYIWMSIGTDNFQMEAEVGDGQSER